MASEIDWAAIKAEYITTDTSYRKLADKYGVSPTSVCNRSKAERWAEQREHHCNTIVTKTVSKTATTQSNKLARLITASEKTLDVALRALEDKQQFNRFIVQRKEGAEGNFEECAEEQIFQKVDTKALKDLTGVIKDLTGLMRDFYNIPTQAQAESQRIAAERLKLDQQKSSVADTSGNGNTGVVLLPPIDETQLEPPIEEDSGEDEER